MIKVSKMKKIFGPEGEKIISEINITPLTDVFLVLLIIFMVTTPILIQSSIKVSLPKAVSSEEKVIEPITVTITKENRIYIDNENVSSVDALVTKLEKKLTLNKSALVIINADKGVFHGRVVDVLDAAKKAGARKLAIGVEKKNEP